MTTHPRVIASSSRRSQLNADFHPGQWEAMRIWLPTVERSAHRLESQRFTLSYLVTACHRLGPRPSSSLTYRPHARPGRCRKRAGVRAACIGQCRSGRNRPTPRRQRTRRSISLPRTPGQSHPPGRQLPRLIKVEWACWSSTKPTASLTGARFSDYRRIQPTSSLPYRLRSQYCDNSDRKLTWSKMW